MYSFSAILHRPFHFPSNPQLLELLHREKWSPQFGLAAVVLVPTRELALQIFEVLRKIGHYHPFSAGLVIGGKDKDEEASRIAQMNILIATPGRLLQHMSETPEFEVKDVQMVVIDEADLIMDPGFKRDMDAILEEMPKVCAEGDWEISKWIMKEREIIKYIKKEKEMLLV